ncbi:hypothetical protein JZ751_000714 [Albula glossodonta]|uniref:C2H2-type domain-containing protein n=1 Tax=Albula glossodonta TaxID=121402 RepID=A0A8T2PX50_9TELE|nr:hypothetical protein JZ751_000714 [Albula glossodonta]
MEVLTKAAIAEICELVDDGYAVLHLEISRSHKENEALKRKLRLMELKIARASGERRREIVNLVKSRSVSGVQVCDEFSVSSRVKDHIPTPERDFSVGSQPGVSLWRDAELSVVDKEEAPVMPNVHDESPHMEEDQGPETLCIKKEGLDEDMENSDAQRGMKVDDERPLESDGGEKSPIVDTQTVPATSLEELNEQQRIRPGVWEDNELDEVLKAEPEMGISNPQDTAERLKNHGSDYALYEKPGQLDTFFSRGNSETETEGPACSYSPAASSDSPPSHSERRVGPAAVKSASDRLSPVEPPDVKPDVIVIDSEPLQVDVEMHSGWTKEAMPGVVHTQQRHYNEFGEGEDLEPGTAVQLPVMEDSSESDSLMNRHFSMTSRVKGHNRASSREKRFICGYCGKSFTCPKYLQTHQRVHTGEKPYSCMHCGKRFAQSSYLKKHQTVHTGEKPFGCTQCGKRFADSSNLIRHKSVHTGERPFICIHCGERFAGKHNLKIHQQRNHPSVWSVR